MYYLNTTRHLVSPADDATADRLMALLTEQVVPRASTLEGLHSISWMLSLDGRTLQAFSAWDAQEDLTRAEHSAQHTQNGPVINELLGGLSRPQEHSYYRLLGAHTVA